MAYWPRFPLCFWQCSVSPTYSQTFLGESRATRQLTAPNAEQLSVCRPMQVYSLPGNYKMYSWADTDRHTRLQARKGIIVYISHVRCGASRGIQNVAKTTDLLLNEWWIGSKGEKEKKKKELSLWNIISTQFSLCLGLDSYKTAGWTIPLL